jgi:hypothetical protein
MQTLSINYPVLGLVILALVAFGFAYAFLVVRKATEKNVQHTALWVVLGVATTVSASAFVIGIDSAAILMVCFAASGAPMFYEYYSRTHQAQAKDIQQAKELARKMLE